jgi:hypothetical protein
MITERAQCLTAHTEEVINAISYLLTNFDWVQLAKEMHYLALWNATHLFFKRGLYEVPLFPPVMGLNIPRYTLIIPSDDDVEDDG